MAFPLINALSEHYLQEKEEGYQAVEIIHIDASLDMLKKEIIDSQSEFWFISEKINCKITHFGVEGFNVSENEFTYASQHSHEIFWITKDIRKLKYPNSLPKIVDVEICTNAGIAFYNRVSKIKGPWMCSFDISSILPKYVPGVNCPSSTEGFTELEGIEICLISGFFNCRIIEFSECNGAIEMYKTSLTIVKMIYYFLIGQAIRNKFDQQNKNN